MGALEDGVKVLVDLTKGGLSAFLGLVGMIVGLLVAKFGIETALELIKTAAEIIIGLIP